MLIITDRKYCDLQSLSILVQEQQVELGKDTKTLATLLKDKESNHEDITALLTKITKLNTSISAKTKELAETNRHTCTLSSPGLSLSITLIIVNPFHTYISGTEAFAAVRQTLIDLAKEEDIENVNFFAKPDKEKNW